MFNIMGKLFGTDGVRGIINSTLTPEMALRLGKAIGTFFGKGSSILIGRDARAGGEMIFAAVASGLISTGIKVYDGGYAPTPAIQYAIKQLGYDGGVMITASHNPPQYNGIKVLSNTGIEVSRDDENKIEEYYFENRFNEVEWGYLTYTIRREDRVIETYLNGIKTHVDVEKIRNKEFKVLVDGANSVGGLTTPMLARELGCKVYTLNANLDPLFPARLPEPTPETLTDTAKVAKSLNVDLGVAHDGDADRAIFIDSKGRVQWGDRSGALLSRWAKEKGVKAPNRIYTAVSSSSLVEEYLSKFDIKVEWTKVGSINIAYALKENGGLAGFEENGGFIFPPHQLVRDGAMTFALMLELLAIENITSADLFDTLPTYYTVKTKVELKPNANLQAIYDKVKSVWGNNAQIIEIDGVKISQENLKILVRKSGTEPIIRIFVESKDLQEAEKAAEEVKKLVEEVQ